MEVTAVSTDNILLQDNTTDIPTRMTGFNSTIDGRSTMMSSYTTITDPKISTAFFIFYFVMKFIFCGFAIFGNTLTIIAVVRFERLQSNTNFLICSLAVTDMVGCFAAPVNLAHEMLTDQPIFVPLCLIHRTIGAISLCMNYCSLLGIAIDRYIFIAHGLRYHTWVTSTKIYTIIGITWVFVITEITTIFVLSYLAIGITFDGILCPMFFLSKLVFWTLLVPQLYILGSLTVVFYVAIARIAYKQGQAIAALNQPYDTLEATLNRQHKKIAKMMVTVLGVYFTCYTPLLIGIAIKGSSHTSFWLHYEKVAALIYWAHIWLNPLIYAWKDEDFRTAFRKLLGLKADNAVSLPGFALATRQIANGEGNVNLANATP